MPIGNSPVMPPLIATLGLVGIAIACFVVGVLALSICGGGSSLAFFGLGLIPLALLASLSGGGPISLAVGSIFGLLLIVAGFVIQHAVGCAIFL
jgi:hypothetical protein